MESQITTIGTILLGAFYALGYVLNRRVGAEDRIQKADEPSGLQPNNFMMSLSSATSHSTSLNVQLWERVNMLEQQQQLNHAQIKRLVASNRKKTRRIDQLEKQVREVKQVNTRLLAQLKKDDPELP